MNLDDDLRAALRGTDPVGDGDGDFTDVTRRAAGIRRRHATIRAGVLGFVALVVIGGGVLLTGGDDEQGVVANQPDGSTTSSTAPSTTSSTTTTATTAPAVPAEPTTTTVPRPELPDGVPAQVVAIDGDGDLVVVDTATGEVLERLASDPDGPDGIDRLLDIGVGPAGEIYYTSTQNPSLGLLQRVGDPLPEGTGFGDWIAVAGDGRTAVALRDSLTTGHVDGGDGEAVTFGEATLQQGPHAFSRPTWSVDGTSLAVLDHGDYGDTAPIVIYQPGAPDSPPVTVFAPSVELVWGSPSFRSDGVLLAPMSCQDLTDGTVDTECAAPTVLGRLLDPSTGEVVGEFDYLVDRARRVVDQNHDVSGTWLLVTFDDGTLRWYGDGTSGVVPGSYSAADW